MADRKTTYFISDCHLGAKYIADPRHHERVIVDWLQSIAGDAARLYLLGDILDYWYEYRYVVPRGYTRFFGALAALADAGVEITWMKGNHDIWLYDYLRDEIGLTVEDGVIRREIDGYMFLLGHGDSIDDAGPFYKLMRSMFRCRFLQWLYGGIHPRWTVGFAHGWSANNRERNRIDTQYTAPDDPHGGNLPDNDGYVRFVRNYMDSIDKPLSKKPVYFVFGHRHFLLDQQVGNDARLIVLGDAFSRMTYGKFENGLYRLLEMPQK